MHMYVDGKMTIADKHTYEMRRDRYFCRELALSGFRRQTLGRITIANTDVQHSLLYLLVLQRLPVQMELNIYFEPADHEALSNKVIDDVHGLLAAHYPLVTFEMHEVPELYQSGLRNVRLQGYKLRGNSQVIPAFFWSLLFFRECIEHSMFEYTTLAALLESPAKPAQDDDYDDEFLEPHKEAFERLLAGTEPPAECMLASGNGPIDTFEGHEHALFSAHLARIDKTGFIRHYEEILNNVIS